MIHTVSITSQGQISIPVEIRRRLGLSKKKKALVSVYKGKMMVEPVKDFLELGGTLKTSRKASIKDTRKAFEVHLANESK